MAVGSEKRCEESKTRRVGVARGLRRGGRTGRAVWSGKVQNDVVESQVVTEGIGSIEVESARTRREGMSLVAAITRRRKRVVSKRHGRVARARDASTK